MISNAIFPCVFTDGARIIGELSYTLCKPVCTDQMIIEDLTSELAVEQDILTGKLFSTSKLHGVQKNEKQSLINRIRYRLDEIVNNDVDCIYYGFFSSLLESDSSCTNKILIVSEDACRLQRAMRQENLNAYDAIRLMEEHDRKAASWTQFLFNSHPYNPELYDIVVHYECQDLLDVISYIFMRYEERLSGRNVTRILKAAP